jgi:DNA-binding transcriptional ArsR family regulator
VIDRLREQIQQRLDQVVGEADRLRKALAALDPRSSPAPAPTAASPTAPGRKGAPAMAGSTTPATTPATARRTTQAPASRRTAPGATKAAVLTALAGGTEMTAGQVADKSGLPRATVSPTLSRLAKNGDVQKAPRGYRLAPTSERSATS